MLYYSPIEGHGAVYGRPVDLITLVRLGLTTEIHTENVKGLDVGKVTFSKAGRILHATGRIGFLHKYVKEREAS